MNVVSKLVCVSLLALAAPAYAQEPGRAATEQARTQRAAQEREQREEMQREAEEAARAIGAYSLGRRDQAQAHAKEALDAIDQRIQRMNQAMSQEAQRQHAEAQAARERQQADVRARRAEAEQRYRDMAASNASVWERARDRFVRAYRDLAARFGAKPAPPDAGDTQQAPAKTQDAAPPEIPPATNADRRDDDSPVPRD